MNSLLRLSRLAFGLLLISPLANAEQEGNSIGDSPTEFLTWTLRDERIPADVRTFKAKFIGLSGDGEKVTLQKEGGGGATYPFAMLSPASVEQAKKLGVIATLEEKKEGDFTYAIKDNSISIIACNGQNGSIAFPEKIANLPVTAIEIPYDRMKNSEGTTSVTIPSGVTSIAVPFGMWKSLSTIMVDAANPGYRSIDGVLFNKSMTELIQYPVGRPDANYAIPHGVTHIGRSAFWPCPLTEVSIPSSVTHIGWAAFSGTGLISVTIPASVTNIEANAFSGCESLTSMIFEGNAPKIELPNFYKTPSSFALRYYKGSTGFAKTEFIPDYEKMIPVEIDPTTELFDWTSRDNKAIKANFVKLDGESVVVRTEDGKEHKIPFTRLSPASVAQAKMFGGAN